jgi:starch phosphorylase
MHLADLRSYADAQRRLAALYEDRQAWAQKAILNVGCSGRSTSDRTIAEYAGEIWHAEPSPVP